MPSHASDSGSQTSKSARIVGKGTRSPPGGQSLPLQPLAAPCHPANANAVSPTQLRVGFHSWEGNADPQWDSNHTQKRASRRDSAMKAPVGLLLFRLAADPNSAGEEALTGSRQVTTPVAYFEPNRPARPAICLISATVSGRCSMPSNFSRRVNTMRLPNKPQAGQRPGT